MSIKTKVCGLTQLEDIHFLITLNVDFLGFIFHPASSRYVLPHLNLKQISEIEHPQKVGVFVNENNETLLEIAYQANLNVLQLHGDESDEDIQWLYENKPKKTKLIKVYKIDQNATKIDFSPTPFADYHLLDTSTPKYGGSGKCFNWDLCNGLPTTVPYFLSGGIAPTSFAEIRKLETKPFAVDINSKFEVSPGKKNTILIKEFMKNLTSTKTQY